MILKKLGFIMKTRICLFLSLAGLFLIAPVLVTPAYADAPYSPEAEGVLDQKGENLADAADANAASADGAGAQNVGTPEQTLERASEEEAASAIGHYARSRSLLIAALREFDSGSKIAKPDSIIDSKEWRSDLIDRAKDLEHILAPQPRVSKGGVRFEADNRLLKGNSGE